MTDLAAFVLLALSSLFMHVYALTGLVATFRKLPAGWLESFWAAGTSLHDSVGWLKWAAPALGALAVIPTWLMALAIANPRMAGGLAGQALAAAELVIATLYLAYLLFGARGPRIQ
jgi:hypothetical protein